MRTTITLDQDVEKAVQQMRKEQSVGLSEAINALIRAGLAARPPRIRYEHRARDVGLRIDATNVAEAVETLEGPESR